jgi:HlyD family secretion protein
MKISGKARFLILLCLLGGSAYLAHSQGRLMPIIKEIQKLAGGKEEKKLQAKDFEFNPVTRQDVRQKVLSTGSVAVTTGAEVKIGARISGQLRKLFAKIGDVVKQGDVIAVIEHDDLLARVARFSADIRAEEARLNKIQQEGPLEISKARADLEELQTRLELAQKTLNRNRELRKQGVVSDSSVDSADEAVKVLEAQIKSSGEDIKLRETRLQMDVELARTIVERAKAGLLEEETSLSYATVTAPIDGVVAYISTQEGETVVASLSAPTFVTLIDLSQLEVIAFVDETDIGRVKVDQKAIFTVDSYSEKIFKSVVHEIRPKAVIKDNVVNYEVMLQIDPSSVKLLRPEMTANVVITTGVHKKVLTIPKEAVKRTQEKSFVIVLEAGKLVEKTVETGWREEKIIEITSGLEEGNEVGVPKKPEVGKKEGPARRR